MSYHSLKYFLLNYFLSNIEKRDMTLLIIKLPDSESFPDTQLMTTLKVKCQNIQTPKPDISKVKKAYEKKIGCNLLEQLRRLQVNKNGLPGTWISNRALDWVILWAEIWREDKQSQKHSTVAFTNWTVNKVLSKISTMSENKKQTSFLHHLKNVPSAQKNSISVILLTMNWLKSSSSNYF